MVLSYASFFDVWHIPDTLEEEKWHACGLGKLTLCGLFPNFLPTKTGVIVLRILSPVYMPITILKMHTYEDHLLTALKR